MSEPTVSVSQNKDVKELLFGLLLTLTFAVAAFITWWFLRDTWLKFSALLWAFVYSIIAVNLIPALSGDKFKMGVEFSSTKLLRWAIALLGLTISASIWVNMGGIGLAVILINLTFAFVFGFLFCRYVYQVVTLFNSIVRDFAFFYDFLFQFS